MAFLGSGPTQLDDELIRATQELRQTILKCKNSTDLEIAFNRTVELCAQFAPASHLVALEDIFELLLPKISLFLLPLVDFLANDDATPLDHFACVKVFQLIQLFQTTLESIAPHPEGLRVLASDALCDVLILQLVDVAGLNSRGAKSHNLRSSRVNMEVRKSVTFISTCLHESPKYRDWDSLELSRGCLSVLMSVYN